MKYFKKPLIALLGFTSFVILIPLMLPYVLFVELIGKFIWVGVKRFYNTCYEMGEDFIFEIKIWVRRFELAKKSYKEKLNEEGSLSKSTSQKE